MVNALSFKKWLQIYNSLDGDGVALRATSSIEHYVDTSVKRFIFFIFWDLKKQKKVFFLFVIFKRSIICFKWICRIYLIF